MMTRFKNELLLISILLILLIIIITFFPSSVLRIILGLPSLLFFPGYTLIEALFPKRTGLDNIERVALSFALSIAVVAFIGAILNYTLWGITLYHILTSLTAFVIVSSIIVWLRQQRLVEEEKPTIASTLSINHWSGQNRVDRILSVILVAAILGTAGTIGCAIANPVEKERFTEFYVLGAEGKAEAYPEQLTMGEKAIVIIGIVNHEHQDMSYRVEITMGRNKCGEITPIVLGHEEKWQGQVSFTPVKVADKQKVEFVLYSNGEPSKWLHLWVSVIEGD